MKIHTTAVAAALASVLLGSQPAWAQKTIDDFRSGPYSVVIRTGEATGVRAGSMLGHYRYTRLIVGDAAANPHRQPGGLDILRTGHLVVSGGYRVFPRVEVVYGVGSRGQNAPLNENLAAFGDRFKLHFASADRQLNVNIVVYTGTTWASLGYNLPASDQAFTQEFTFAEFTSNGDATVSWGDIDHIVVVVQSASLGSDDWALTKFEVVNGPGQ